MEVNDMVGAAKRYSHYLAKAFEADERAAGCTQIETQKTWTELASSWRFMAGQIGEDFKL